MSLSPGHSWRRNDPRTFSGGWVCSRCGGWMSPEGDGPPGPGPQSVAVDRLYIVRYVFASEPPASVRITAVGQPLGTNFSCDEFAVEGAILVSGLHDWFSAGSSFTGGGCAKTIWECSRCGARIYSHPRPDPARDAFIDGSDRLFACDEAMAWRIHDS